MEGATMAEVPARVHLTFTRATVLASYMGSNPGAPAGMTTLNVQKAQKWLVEQGLLAPRTGVPAHSITDAGLKALVDVAFDAPVPAAPTAVAFTHAPAPDNDRPLVVGDLVLTSRERGHLAVTRYILQQIKPLNGIPFAWLRQVGETSFPIRHLSDVQLFPVYAGPAATLPAAA